MLRKLLVVAAAVVIIIFCLNGCKKEADTPEPDKPGEQPVTKTLADHEEEAEKEITKKNMAAELERLEKEIERDSRLER